jgi:predicted transcriptional regulator YdeE
LERFGPLLLTGILQRHDRARETYAIAQAIGRQWNDYMARRVAPPWTAEAYRYGICHQMADGDTEIAYFCGAPPPVPPEPRAGFVDVTLAPLTIAVFPFDRHILEFRTFVHAVFGTELALAGLKPAPGGPGVPDYIERYGVAFDPLTGKGGFELLVPVKE